MINKNNINIAIIGLGYVGLPLAVEFGKKFTTFGFDINQSRIKELQSGYDMTLEVKFEELIQSSDLKLTSVIDDIRNCNIYIITVPTPIDSQKKPDLRPLENSSKSVGRLLNKNDIVIYESTVFPGATEEVCVPILEKYSGLVFNKDFFCGYSPERINPGDKEHTLTSIKKITSGSTPKIATQVDLLYKSIITAGTHKTPSIKVAEAAKVIENTQRDVNIALINELSLIFNKLEVDTEAVLEAAGTKWNFLQFKPGLVGGHCIGVDPYYLTDKATKVGYDPQIILAGRRINDNMGNFVVTQVVELMEYKKILIQDANILIMGLTFKENCPDLRNTKVVDLVNGFKSLGCNVDIFDPWVDSTQSMNEYGIKTIARPISEKYDAIILAVIHEDFKKLSLSQIKSYGKNPHVLYDIKYLFKADEVDGRL
jgi:UDP-N-acetyl-D-glucosamine/UDP-N-acetyl-D-galactosamine dehydrogenase